VNETEYETLMLRLDKAGQIARELNCEVADLELDASRNTARLNSAMVRVDYLRCELDKIQRITEGTVVINRE